MGQKIKEWFGENKDRLLIVVGLFLVSIFAFEAGVIYSSTQDQKPLVLSIPAPPSENEVVSEKSVVLGVTTSGQSNPSVKTSLEANPNGGEKNCVFVGSKNSNKYHLATCAVAKRIKVENKVCFSSKEDAEKRGYIASCLK